MLCYVTNSDLCIRMRLTPPRAAPSSYKLTANLGISWTVSLNFLSAFLQFQDIKTDRITDRNCANRNTQCLQQQLEIAPVLHRLDAAV